ncbi:flagellar basal-body rod protein FlgF [Clostridia bacterium]|nr:flagellar basal-body rod protein FlgF [Clostridia bacterium]
MLRSMYTAGTAMLTYNRKMDVITNNLANVETRGYKMDTMATRSFRDMLISRINDPNMYVSDAVGGHNTGIHVDQNYTTFTQGALESTDNKMDLALTDDGFFVIDYTGEDDEDEVLRYTRNGAFNVDAEGMLVTADGHYVMGEGGAINVGDKDFTVDREGTVFNSAGEELDRLLVMRFPDNRALRKDGDNMYFNYDPEGNDPEQVNVDVLQGYLEDSNVDSAREMVNMMQTYRAYEINQRVLRIVDESLGRAVNDIARM